MQHRAQGPFERETVEERQFAPPKGGFTRVSRLKPVQDGDSDDGDGGGGCGGCGCGGDGGGGGSI